MSRGSDRVPCAGAGCAGARCDSIRAVRAEGPAAGTAAPEPTGRGTVPGAGRGDLPEPLSPRPDLVRSGCRAADGGNPRVNDVRTAARRGPVFVGPAERHRTPAREAVGRGATSGK